MIGIQLLEAYIAVGAHFHEHIFVVGRIEQLKQEVLRRDRYFVGADVDAAGFDFLRTSYDPCAARIPFEQIRADGRIEPQHIRIQRRRCRAAPVDLLCVVRRSRHPHGDVVSIL